MNARPAMLLILNASLANTLSTLLNPNVIFLLFIVALIGIFVEVSHPGAIFPGVVGSIALILFLFGAWFLSPNWVGLGFMALTFILLILDIKLPAHGVLTIGAVISLILGALLFFNSGRTLPGTTGKSHSCVYNGWACWHDWSICCHFNSANQAAICQNRNR